MAQPEPATSRDPFPLSIAIVAQDEEANLRRCLESTAGLAEEVVVVDAGSRDKTREVAGSFGARVVHQDWLGYRDQKNCALGQCTKPWVLALDCDEELSPELRASIEGFLGEVAGDTGDGREPGFAGAVFNRKTWFLGRWITHGDWYPDRKLRLFRRAGARWGGSPEHDKIELQGPTTRLAGDLHHYSFRDTGHYIAKMSRFADEFLERQRASGRRWSLWANLARPAWRFFRAYVLRRGFLDGFPGLWIAVSTAYFAFVRYSKRYGDGEGDG